MPPTGSWVRFPLCCSRKGTDRPQRTQPGISSPVFVLLEFFRGHYAALFPPRFMGRLVIRAPIRYLSTMSTVQEIESAITQLKPGDIHAVADSISCTVLMVERYLIGARIRESTPQGREGCIMAAKELKEHKNRGGNSGLCSLWSIRSFFYSTTRKQKPSFCRRQKSPAKYAENKRASPDLLVDRAGGAQQTEWELPEGKIIIAYGIIL